MGDGYPMSGKMMEKMLALIQIVRGRLENDVIHCVLR
jgi:hypothetical protein